MATLSEAFAIAVASHQAGRLDHAAEIYRRILAAEPAHAAAWHMLGLVALQRGRYADAEAWLRQAVALGPGSNDPTQGPGMAEAYASLGIVLRRQGRLGDAVAAYEQAVALKADYAEGHYNLAIALLAQGRLEEAIASYRRARQLKPHDVLTHNNLLLALQYHPASTLATLAQAHAEFDAQQTAALRATWPTWSRADDPQRRLRLGFVSADLCRSPVGFFCRRLFEHLDRRQAEVVCYSPRTAEDDLTQHLRAAAAAWREVRTLTDEQLAAQIRADRIDILFDLGGHTGGNRLLTFARHPAPLQISWLGYVGTTGLSAMDYLLADAREVPPPFERFYRENVLCLPDDYVCYAPPAYAPPVGPLPARATGRVTFGSFNNLAKITPQVVTLWARILQRRPDARLVLKYFGLEDPPTAARLRQQFADHGLRADQLELWGGGSHEELLTCYNRIDVALDTFPYNGGLTTCEALWMGVPVVTWPGETFASRHSLTHLTSVGLTETIARDPDQYVALALGLVDDLPRLAALRAGLRERMARSPLCDGRRFADNLLRLLRDIWQQWLSAVGRVR
jgi:predicted O-linked N-acetylglucosamine transferase (SPINDLY family)